MPPSDKVKVGVAAIVESPHKHIHGLLLIRRVGQTGLSADGYNTWSVPGGWLEYGEDPYQAAVREVKEETDIQVRPVNKGPYFVTHSEISVVTLFVACRYVSGTPKVTEPDKCADVGWVDWTDVTDGRPLFDPFHQYLKYYGLT